MKNKQTMFFATYKDIEFILKEFESIYSIKYYKTGLTDSKEIQMYNSAFEISNLGFAHKGDWNLTDNFLIMPTNIRLNVRIVNQKKGGLKYAVDQMMNPCSIAINFGGIYLDKEFVLVAGHTGTISNDQVSIDIYNYFTKRIKKEFKLIDNFYVGKESINLLKAGWRLVTNEKLAQGFDLSYK